MISQYSQPADFQIQPIDWDKAFQVGALQQHRHDAVEDEAYKLQALMASVPAIDEHKQFKQALDNEYYAKINDAYDKLNKGDVHGASSSLRKTALDWQMNSVKNELFNSYENYHKDYLPNHEKTMSEGKYDPMYWNQYEKFKGVRSDGSINPFRYQGALPKEDYIENAQSLVQGIAKDAKTWEGYVTDKKTGLPTINAYGQILKKNGKYEALPLDKIRLVAESNFEGLIKGKGGRYFVDETLGQPVNYNSLDDNYKTVVKERGVNLLTKLALKQITESKSSGMDYQNIPEHNFGDNESDNGRIEDSPFQDVNYHYDNILDAIELKNHSFKNAISNGPQTPETYGDTTTTKKQGPSRNIDNLSLDEKQTVNRLKSLFPGKDDNETYNNISKYLKSIKEKKVSVPYIAYEPKKIESESKFLRSNILGRLIYDPQTNKTYDGTDFMNKVVEGDTYDKKQSSIDAIGEGSTDNYYTDISGNDRFAQPQMINVQGKSYVVGMSKGEYDSPAGQFKIALNHLTASKRSGIPVNLNDNYKGVSSYKKNDEYPYRISYEANGGKHTIKADDPTQALMQYIEETRKLK